MKHDRPVRSARVRVIEAEVAHTHAEGEEQVSYILDERVVEQRRTPWREFESPFE